MKKNPYTFYKEKYLKGASKKWKLQFSQTATQITRPNA
jgi:hypothetical protein